jgi:hypothetical protein
VSSSTRAILARDDAPGSHPDRARAVEEVDDGADRRLILAGGWRPSVMHVLERAIAVPFFIIHFGMFTGFQGAVINLMWAWFSAGLRPEKPYGVLELMTVTFRYGGWPLWSAILFLVVSHGYSFCVNTVGGREYRNTTLESQMGAPYIRVAIMMGVVIGGMLVLTVTEAPRLFGALLVVCKIVFDVRAHLKERENLAREEDAAVLPAGVAKESA